MCRFVAPQFVNLLLQSTRGCFCRVVWGERGASNALAVAQQLGFDRAVLTEAKEWAKRLSVQGRDSAENAKKTQDEMQVGRGCSETLISDALQNCDLLAMRCT